MIDSLRYGSLANALGIDVAVNNEKTIAVIIDAAVSILYYLFIFKRALVETPLGELTWRKFL